MSISTAQQLGLYNGALRLVGNARLQTLTDNQEARYLLDDVWNDGVGVPQACLEQGYWYFATRTSKLTNDVSITPNFGYNFAFEKPADWVRTSAVCQDEMFLVPLTQIRDETGYWFTLLQTIFVAYVSNDPSYGLNFGIWPESFIRAVEGYMAKNIVRKLCAGDESKIAAVQKEAERLLIDARSKAAMNESEAFFPAGTWLRSRWGRWGGQSDRGSTGSLYG